MCEGETSGVTAPPQCAALAVDSALMLEWMMEPSDSAAVASFVQDDDDEAGVFVRVAAGSDAETPDVPDVSGCADFSRETSNEMGQMVKSFQAVPAEVDVDGFDGAEGVVAADIAVTGLTIDGEQFDAESVGEEVRFITGAVDGTGFSLVATGEVSDDVVASLASAQVERLTNSPA